jgi:hypothetical protein
MGLRARSTEDKMNHAELRHAFDQKVRAGIFAPVARHLPEDIREDRLQDAVCQTWAMYERYAERGELLDDAILVHACRLRATDPSRFYVPADGPRKKDVYDVRNFMEGNVEVLRFADFIDEEKNNIKRESAAPTGFGLAEAASNDPTRRLMSAVDLTAWLDEQLEADVAMLALRQAGHTLEDIGAKSGGSTSYAFGRLKRLGEELAERAGVSLGATTEKEKKMASTRLAAAPRNSRTRRSACAA